MKKKLLALIVFLLALFGLIYSADRFFDAYDLKFQSPIIIQTPLKVEKRQVKFRNPLIEVVEAQEPQKLPTIAHGPIEEEILEVFGEEHFGKALKVFKCESGLDPKAINKANPNGTIDVGIPQINTVHGIAIKWLENYEIAIRVAKQLYDEQGWSPWHYSYNCHGIK